MEREMDPGKMQVHILYFTHTGSVLAAKLARELARVERTSHTRPARAAAKSGRRNIFEKEMSWSISVPAGSLSARSHRTLAARKRIRQ